MAMSKAEEVVGAEAGRARWANIWAEAIWLLPYSCEANLLCVFWWMSHFAGIYFGEVRPTAEPNQNKSLQSGEATRISTANWPSKNKVKAKLPKLKY